MNPIDAPKSITVIDNDHQTIHVHASGCRDIAHSVTALTAPTAPDVTTFASHGEAAALFFGDVIADRFDYGTDEWAAEVASEWRSEARIFPCARI